MAITDLSLGLGFDITVKTALMKVLSSSRAIGAAYRLPPDQIAVLAEEFGQKLAKVAGIRKLELLDPKIVGEALGPLVVNTQYSRIQLEVPLISLPTPPPLQVVTVCPEPLRHDMSVDQILSISDRVDPVTLLLYVNRFRELVSGPVFTVWEDSRKNPCIIYAYPYTERGEVRGRDLPGLALESIMFSRGRANEGRNMLVSRDQISEDWDLLIRC